MSDDYLDIDPKTGRPRTSGAAQEGGRVMTLLSGLLATGYRRKLKKLVIAGDVKGLQKLHKKHNPAKPISEAGMRIGLHKLRCTLDGIPEHLRRESEEWLTERGYRTYIKPTTYEQVEQARAASAAQKEKE